MVDKYGCTVMLKLQIATFMLYGCAANYLNNYFYRKNFLRTIQVSATNNILMIVKE